MVVTDVSIAAMQWALERADTDDPSEVLVLIAIAHYCDALGAGAFPSLDTIARVTRLQRRSVRRVLRRLDEKKLVLVTPAVGRRSARYALPLGTRRGDQRSPLQESVEGTVGHSREDPPSRREDPPSHREDPRSPDPSDPSIDPSRSTRARERFAELWKIYPKKTERFAAERAYSQVVGDDAAIHRQVLDAVPVWAKSPEWQKEGGRFAKRLSVFLIDRLFEERPQTEADEGPSYPEWIACKTCGDCHIKGRCPTLQCVDCRNWHPLEEPCHQRKSREAREAHTAEVEAFAAAEGLTFDEASTEFHRRHFAAARARFGGRP